jgi:hypothetical protein
VRCAISNAGSADQQDFLVTLDEAARREVDDLGLRDLRVIGVNYFLPTRPK